MSLFQLTPSRRATSFNDPERIHAAFQLTPSRRATSHRRISSSPSSISTHALTEGDRVAGKLRSVLHHFNSRPHGGRRPTEESHHRHPVFQLTPSRRATASLENYVRFYIISTHALTEGDDIGCCLFFSLLISTHALTEGDGASLDDLKLLIAFQLTPSRRATFPVVQGNQHQHFNSRPHGGRRHPDTGLDLSGRHFNSRPHGGRRIHSRKSVSTGYFNSRPHGGRPPTAHHT